MKIYLILITLLIGAVLSIHLAMNAQVGDMLKNPRMGNAIFWTIGGITAIIIGMTAWDSSVFTALKGVPLWLLTAGAMGACLVFGIAWTIPQFGAANTFSLMIASQLVTGLILSHFGLLGSPTEPVSLTKIIGAVMLLGGALIVSYK